MRIVALSAIVAMLFLFQGCDITQLTRSGRDSIRQQAEAGLKSYFPKATVVIDEQRHQMIGITCTANLGELAVRNIIDVLEQNPDVQKLKHFGPLVGVNGFALGFDRQLIFLNISTGQYSIISADSLPNYSAQYASQCGLQNTEESVARAYIWVGNFKVGVRQSNGSISYSDIQDTLGMNPRGEFEGARESEIRTRREVFSEYFQRRGMELVSLDLVGVRKIAVP